MSAPFTKEGPVPFATYAVVQRGVLTGAVGGSLTAATKAGNTLFIYIVSNSATLPTVTLTGGVGGTVRTGYWSAGHGSNWTGLFYVLNTPAGITGYTTSGIYGSSWREVSGIVSNPIVVWNFGGNATAGTTFTVPVPGATTSGDFVTQMFDYSASNGGTPYADGWTDDAAATNFGQTSYTTGTTAASGTMASSAYDAASILLKQVNNVGTPPVNWTAVGSPVSRNVTSGQGTWAVTVSAAGNLLVIYTKTAASLNYVNTMSGGGATWAQCVAGYTDNNATPHVQQCWFAKAVNTGSQTITFNYAAAIGSTAVEMVFQEFNPGTGPFQYTAEGGGGRNNGNSAYVTWPAVAPSTANGELWLGFARVITPVSPYTSPSGPAVLYTDVASNPFIYALNMCQSFQPQCWNGSGSSNGSLSYATSCLIIATSLTISGLSDNSVIDSGSGTLGLSSPVAGSALADTLDANGTIALRMAVAASSATASTANGSISATGVITGSSSTASAANGTVTLRIVIAGSSATGSPAAGTISATGVITGSSATGSPAAGTVFIPFVTSGLSATSSAGSSGAIVQIGALSGSSSTGSAGSGLLATVYGISGTSSTATSASGTLGTVSPAAGTSATASAASGSITQTMVIAGNSSTATAASGAISRYSPLAGMSATVSSASGSITQICAVAGTSITVSSGTGTIGGSPPVAGNSVTQSSVSGGLVLICAVSGSAVTVTSATGSIGRVSPLAGSSSTASAASGTITATLALAGSSVTSSAGSGSLGRLVPVTGASATASLAAGSITATLSLAGSSATFSAASGSLGGAVPMAGSSATSSSAAGSVTALLVLAGSSATASAGYGSLGGAAPMAGTSVTGSLAAGSVTALLVLAGSSQTASSGQGTLSGTAALSGLSATATAAYGTVYEVGEVDGLSSTPSAGDGTLVIAGGLSGFSSTASAGYGTLVTALGIDGLSATPSAGYGTLLPPFVAGLLPPEVTADITVRSGPRASVSVKQTDSAITVRKSGAVLVVSGVSSSISSVRTTAKVTLWICKSCFCGRETTRR
jgi:hypothetical protein